MRFYHFHLINMDKKLAGRLFEHRCFQNINREKLNVFVHNVDPCMRCFINEIWIYLICCCCCCFVLENNLWEHFSI